MHRQRDPPTAVATSKCLHPLAQIRTASHARDRACSSIQNEPTLCGLSKACQQVNNFVRRTPEAAAGNRRTTAVPLPGLTLQRNAAPCSSTMDFTREIRVQRLADAARDRHDKTDQRLLAEMSAAMPHPVSSTRTSAPSRSSSRTEITIRPPAGVWRRLLSNRLLNARRNSPASPLRQASPLISKATPFSSTAASNKSATAWVSFAAENGACCRTVQRFRAARNKRLSIIRDSRSYSSMPASSTRRHSSGLRVLESAHSA